MIKKVLSVILAVLLVGGILSACSIGSQKVVGKWYDKSGKCLDIRKDGSWQLDGLYGKGTWEYLDDGIIEFTDFYGEVDEGELCENSYGSYIDFYHRDFYKDSYPNIGQANQSLQEGSSQNQTENTQPTETEPQAVEINPFEGLRMEVTGVSPFCKLMVNNAGCSEDAQLYVDYTLDASYYQNGDTAVVTASLNKNASSGNYVLAETARTFSVENQPQYITSAEGVDLSSLEREVQDLITARTAESIGSWFLFGEGINGFNTFKSTENVIQEAVYFSSIKRQKQNDTNLFNTISYVYTIVSKTDNSDAFTSHVVITAQNIIQYPDGTLVWGKSENLDLVTHIDTQGLEAIIANQITSKIADYNITKIR